MHFLIYIFDNNVEMFMDMVYMFVEAIKQHSASHTMEIQTCCCFHNKHNCTQHLPFDFNDANKRLVIFGTGLGYHTIPKYSIVTIFDCWALMKERIMNLASNNVILTYSQKDLVSTKQACPQATISLFGFGYSPSLDYYQAVQKQYDAVFIGGWTQRRQTVLDAIKQLGCKVHSPTSYSIYSYQRSQLFNQSKIVLSIYSSDLTFGNTSASRIIPAVCNGAFVIAELSTEEDVNTFLKPFCILCTATEMPQIVKYYATNDDEREQLRAQFHQEIKKHTSQIDMQQIITSHINHS